MAIKLDGAVFHKMGLLYEQTYIAAQLTDEPTGTLNVQALIEGDDKCWYALDKTKTYNKKKIIISSWLFLFDWNEDIISPLTSFLTKLLKEGFDLYIPEKQNLKKKR